jgi:hypothetical protein
MSLNPVFAAPSSVSIRSMQRRRWREPVITELQLERAARESSGTCRTGSRVVPFVQLAHLDQDGQLHVFRRGPGLSWTGFRLGFPVIQPRYYNSEVGRYAFC